MIHQIQDRETCCRKCIPIIAKGEKPHLKTPRHNNQSFQPNTVTLVNSST